MKAIIPVIRFRALFGFALSCFLVLSPARVSAQANVPFEGVFSTGSWRVRLDEKSSTGVFIAVGNRNRKLGESFLTITARTSYNSWRGRAFDKAFTTISESAIFIKGDQLIITPKTGLAYILKRDLPSASTAKSLNSNSGATSAKYPIPRKAYSAPASTSRTTGAGCAAVQCHGITRSGNRCRRTTTNCSGYCYQH